MDEERFLSDAFDYKGRPADKSKTGGWLSAGMILDVEIWERMTTLGIAVNLVPYLTRTMHLGNAVSANTVTNFLGTSYMLSLLGGFIADTFLGRYLTIAISATIQAIGVTVLTISTVVPRLKPPPCSGGGPCVPASGWQLTVLYLALYLTALGTGGLKSSVSGFGSDQFDESSPKERDQMASFFNWFFFFINLGALAAVTVLVYIQDNLGRRWGYGTCFTAIVFGLIVFLSGTRRYRYKKVVGSPLTQIASVVAAAVRKRGLELPVDASLLHEQQPETHSSGEKKKKKKERLPHTRQFQFLDRAAIDEGEQAEVENAGQRRLSTVTDVEEVKMVIRMLPIWATTIIFWTVYAQMTTFSVSQATTMNRHIGPSFKLPPASLTVFFVGSILLTVPIYGRIIIPAARALTGNPQGLTLLQRISLGLLLSVLAMVAAALTEVDRLKSATTSRTAHSPMSVFRLIPQFFLVGSGMSFTYTGQLQFFLKECPNGMKTMSTGLFLSTVALGFFFSSVLVSIVHKATGKSATPWLPDDLNKGRLHYFYWLLSALSAANLCAYMVCANRYVYKDDRLGTAHKENGLHLPKTQSINHN